jgi:hypothetical protein
MNNLFNYFNSFLALFINWLDCIRRPIITCHKIFNLAISDNEKIKFALQIWIIGFLISLCLEMPIYYYYGLRMENSYIFPYLIYGFICLILSSLFMHISLLLFKIKSNFVDTLIIYSVFIGSYSPFILLLSYPIFCNYVLLIKTIKNQNIDILNNIYQLGNIINKEKYYSVTIISAITNTFSIILFCILGVLSSISIMERYNSDKFNSFMSITFFQSAFILPLALFSILKILILYNFL